MSDASKIRCVAPSLTAAEGAQMTAEREAVLEILRTTVQACVPWDSTMRRVTWCEGLEEATDKVLDLISQRPAPEGAITVRLQFKADGGLLVTSDDLPGLILSGLDHKHVGACIVPAIEALKSYNGDAAPPSPAQDVDKEGGER